MPGFNVAPLGGGYSANSPTNVTETRRTYRWVFTSLGRGTGTFTQTELLMLQSAQRPSIEFEEVPMHQNQEVTYFAGKQAWQPMTLVWYDAEQNPDVSRGLYEWIETVVNIASMSVAAPVNYKRTASLQMLTGGGSTSEEWILYGTWPKTCNWKELNYTATEIQTCEAVMRYDRAVRSCLAVPPPIVITPTCPV